ncbi:pseudouridine synthase [Haloferula helveola]|uniref:Pseudouridine synthase n=1 Tax=Haloferula helveola TaxID=490095 RepID=A0ABN6H4Z9_9BACT|nr:pseudouridine synthase [Haloferula helveola]
MESATRLNKFLASCGVGSRRACDKLVQEGHVEINGKPCLNPAERVEERDFVKVDGRRVQPKATGTILMHKPKGLVCTKSDELNRDTIYALLPGSLQHLQHVGRLDRESEGLLVMTNDGQLSQSLLHPSKDLEKEYLVTSNQPVTDEHLDLFLSGIFTEDGRMQAKDIERVSPRRFRVVLTTGHKRQIRVMFRQLGYTVQRLLRIRVGSLDLPAIPPGKWVWLAPADIELLLKNPTRKRSKPARRPAKKAAKKAARKPPAKSAGSARSGGSRDGRKQGRPGPPPGRARGSRKPSGNPGKRRKK